MKKDYKGYKKMKRKLVRVIWSNLILGGFFLLFYIKNRQPEFLAMSILSFLNIYWVVV